MKPLLVVPMWVPGRVYLYDHEDIRYSMVKGRRISKRYCLSQRQLLMLLRGNRKPILMKYYSTR